MLLKSTGTVICCQLVIWLFFKARYLSVLFILMQLKFHFFYNRTKKVWQHNQGKLILCFCFMLPVVGTWFLNSLIVFLKLFYGAK